MTVTFTYLPPIVSVMNFWGEMLTKMFSLSEVLFVALFEHETRINDSKLMLISVIIYFMFYRFFYKLDIKVKNHGKMIGEFYFRYSEINYFDLF